MEKDCDVQGPSVPSVQCPSPPAHPDSGHELAMSQTAFGKMRTVAGLVPPSTSPQTPPPNPPLNLPPQTLPPTPPSHPPPPSTSPLPNYPPPPPNRASYPHCLVALNFQGSGRGIFSTAQGVGCRGLDSISLTRPAGSS